MQKTSGQLELEKLRKKKEIIIPDFSTCYYCKSTSLKTEEKYCPNCRFPQLGTQKEMQGFLYRIRLKKELLAEKKKQINKSRNILYTLGIINIVLGIIRYYQHENFIDILVTLILGGIYLALGFWSIKKPQPAIIAGLFTYIVLIVLGALMDPELLIKGILLKILIIYGFFYGFKGIKEAEKLSKELNDLKKAQDLSE